MKWISTLLLLLLYPCFVAAEWTVVVHKDIDSENETKVAYTENEQGHSLEVYRDQGGAIRSRFNVNSQLERLTGTDCPTYQVDDHSPTNRSVNGAQCIAHREWAEFVLGYAVENQVKSDTLIMMRDGGNIVYRYALETAGYHQTEFSLLGSRRALEEALGQELVIVSN